MNRNIYIYFDKINIIIPNFHDFYIYIMNKKFVFLNIAIFMIFFYMQNFHFNCSSSIKTMSFRCGMLNMVEVQSLIEI